jgi:hypothetical protein
MKKLFILLAAMLTFTTTAFAQIGSLAADLVYTPVTPCRILDTRPSQGGTGPIAANGTKNFLIWGQTTFAGQGGAASNCGIVAGSNTAAVAVNFTVVSPTTPGFITAFPFGATRPTAATVNFNAGDVRGNFSIVKNAQSLGSDLSIFSTSNVDVVGDVVGYYSKPIQVGSLDCTNVAATSASTAGFQTIAATCAAGYITTGGSCDTSNSGAKPNTGSFITATTWTCESNNYPGNTTPATITATARCCRIPGR